MSAKFQNIIRPSFVILRIQGLEGNSVDPEEATHNELPCLGLPCLQKLFPFLTLISCYINNELVNSGLKSHQNIRGHTET